MLKLWLIRHGMTEGNRHGRYIGVTDEPLCKAGRDLLTTVSYPLPQAVYVSPLLRCRQTAEILFPEKEFHVVDDLAECNFGDFENQNYRELSGNADYQAWIDSNGTLPFPGGESREEFRNRTLQGFRRVVRECICENVSDASLVIHGGTIMNIMEAYAVLQRPFYDWHVKNGGGYLIEIDEKDWTAGKYRLNLCSSV